MNKHHPWPSIKKSTISALCSLFMAIFVMNPIFAGQEITIRGQSEISLDGAFEDIEGVLWLTGRLYDKESQAGISDHPIEFLFYPLNSSKPLAHQAKTLTTGTFEIKSPDVPLLKVVAFFRESTFYDASAATFVLPSPKKTQDAPYHPPPKAMQKEGILFLAITSLLLLVGLIYSVLKQVLLTASSKKETAKALLPQNPYGVEKSPLTNVAPNRQSTPRKSVRAICPYSKRPIPSVQLNVSFTGQSEPTAICTNADGQAFLTNHKITQIRAEKTGFLSHTIAFSSAEGDHSAKSQDVITIPLVSCRKKALSLFLTFLEKHKLPKSNTPLQIRDMQSQTDSIKNASSAAQEIAFSQKHITSETLAEFETTLGLDA